MRENTEERGSGLVHTTTKRIYHSVVTNATDDTVLLCPPLFSFRQQRRCALFSFIIRVEYSSWMDIFQLIWMQLSRAPFEPSNGSNKTVLLPRVVPFSKGGFVTPWTQRTTGRKGQFRGKERDV